jgi:integrase/recombinase XerD
LLFGVFISPSELEGLFMGRRARPWYRKERKAWFVCIAGVQHNLGETKKEAFERYLQLMAKPQKRCVSPRSLVAIIDEFLEWVQKHRSPANYEGYRYRLQRFVDRWPDLRPDQLRPFHVQKWADSFEISQTTRRNYLRAVKRCMRWAKQQGYIDDNPIADLEVPSGESREVVIRPAEFERLLSLARDPALHDLLLVAWETGCRPQEILKVTANHVDLANSRWVFKKSEAKMKRKVRIVYLGERSLEITKRLMQANQSGPLFRNTRGRPWTTGAVNCHFKRIRIRMGMAEFKRQGAVLDETQTNEVLARLSKTRKQKGRLVTKPPRELLAEAKRKLRYRLAALMAPRYSLYAIRHSWATNALERGVDALTVAVLMGHSDPSTLARVYQHLSHNPKHLLEQARKAIA